MSTGSKKASSIRWTYMASVSAFKQWVTASMFYMTALCFKCYGSKRSAKMRSLGRTRPSDTIRLKCITLATMLTRSWNRLHVRLAVLLPWTWRFTTGSDRRAMQLAMLHRAREVAVAATEEATNPTLSVDEPSKSSNGRKRPRIMIWRQPLVRQRLTSRSRLIWMERTRREWKRLTGCIPRGPHRELIALNRPNRRNRDAREGAKRRRKSKRLQRLTLRRDSTMVSKKWRPSTGVQSVKTKVPPCPPP